MKYFLPFAKDARLEGDEPTNPGEPALLDRRAKNFVFLAAGAGTSPSASGKLSLIISARCVVRINVTLSREPTYSTRINCRSWADGLNPTQH